MMIRQHTALLYDYIFYDDTYKYQEYIGKLR